MAGDWIPVGKSLSRKRETVAIAAATGRSRQEVVGWLVEFWSWIDDETLNGKVDGLCITNLTHAVGADEQFWRAVESVGWLVLSPAGLRIPHFSRWLGRSAKRRLKENKRKDSSRKMSASRAVKKRTTEQKRREEKRKEDPGEESPGTPLAGSRFLPTPGPAAEPLLSFPTDGREKEWHLFPSKLAELQNGFPSLDVLAECRKALAWVQQMPGRRKTPQGMGKFLFNWLSKAQDSGARSAPANGAARRGEPIADVIDRLATRQEGGPS